MQKSKKECERESIVGSDPCGGFSSFWREKKDLVSFVNEQKHDQKQGQQTLVAW